MMGTRQKPSGIMPWLSLARPRLLLLILLPCRVCVCAARRDPAGGSGRPAGGVYLATWKLCLLVAVPVAAGVALLVSLIVCACRRRDHKNDPVVAQGGADNKVYNNYYYKPMPWSTGRWSSSSAPPDNPRSINATMVCSPSPPVFYLSPHAASSASPPTKIPGRQVPRFGEWDVDDSPSRSLNLSPHADAARHASLPAKFPGRPVPQFGEWDVDDSPSRSRSRSNRPPGLPCAPTPSAAGVPERVRPPKPKEQQEEEAAMIINDPLARYSPAKWVLVSLLEYERLESAANGLPRKPLLGGRVGPWQVVVRDKQLVEDKGLPAAVVIKTHCNTFREEECDRIRKQLKREFTLRHKNLVRLIGYSLGKGRLYLVYEHMSKGSLENHLFPAETSTAGLLDWQARYRIATEVAQGLHPLHTTGRPHGYISVSTIMLDRYYIAYLDDHFHYRPPPDRMNTTPAAETSNAVSHSLEDDIADLGAVFLELVCGRRRTAALSFGVETTMLPLVDWVWAHYAQAFEEPDDDVRDDVSKGAVQREVNRNRIFGAVDPTMDAEINKPQAVKLLTLGLACSHPDPELRPKIRQVREVLLGMKPAPQIPLSKPTTPPSPRE